VEARAVATEAHAMEAEARGDRLQADLHKALTAAMQSEVNALWGRLHTPSGELQALLATVLEGVGVYWPWLVLAPSPGHRR
jgi:hypothetical protein